jgi:twitching motility protein PilT
MADLLKSMVARGASDIHLQAGAPPHMRLDGDLPFEGVPALTPEQTEQIATGDDDRGAARALRAPARARLRLHDPGGGALPLQRLRQRGSVGVVMRVVATRSPASRRSACRRRGQRAREPAARPGARDRPDRSGKSTTLAAMIDFINRRFPRNVITIEDPIEFLHRNQQSLVIQREIGLDTADFVDALKYAMRQDPDVIMVGEMRDKATVEAALTAAQTGHLVLSTLHTLDAIRTVNRVIDFFPPHERSRSASCCRSRCSASSRSGCCRAPTAPAGRWRPRSWSTRR